MPASFCFRNLTLYTLIVALVGPAAGLAQAASSSTAPAGGTVVLSPFEVRSPQDHGYRVGAAVTGTGTAGLIKDCLLYTSDAADE